MSYGGSGSGSGAIHSSSDVALNNPGNGQVLGYSGSVAKWENLSLPVVTASATQPSNMQPGDLWVDTTPLSAIDVNADPLGSATGLQASNPNQVGLVGWSGDPLYATSTMTPSNGRLYLTRIRAVTTGPISKLYYNLGALASGTVSGANWLGLYDTGQATLGTATLLASAAQDTGYTGTLGIKTVTISSLTLQASTDYFLALLVNASVIPSGMFTAFGGPNFQPGLSGTSVRAGIHTTVGLTALPATIAGSSLTNTNASSLLVAFA